MEMLIEGLLTAVLALVVYWLWRDLVGVVGGPRRAAPRLSSPRPPSD
jgi:hypothetical protein